MSLEKAFNLISYDTQHITLPIAMGLYIILLMSHTIRNGIKSPIEQYLACLTYIYISRKKCELSQFPDLESASGIQAKSLANGSSSRCARGRRRRRALATGGCVRAGYHNQSLLVPSCQIYLPKVCRRLVGP